MGAGVAKKWCLTGAREVYSSREVWDTHLLGRTLAARSSISFIHRDAYECCQCNRLQRSVALYRKQKSRCEMGLVWVALAPVFLTIVVLWLLDMISVHPRTRFKNLRRIT